MTDADMMAYADQLMDKGQYENALENYKRILQDYPTSTLHIDTQLKMAECYGALDRWEEQFNQLNRLIKENIIPQQVPQIYVQIGKWYERAALFNPGIITRDSSDYNLAINYYDQALKYPDSDDNITKSEAIYRRALVEAKTGKIDEAIARYKLVSNLFPDSDFSILAQVKLKDPSNVNELPLTDSALTEYKQLLGLIEGPEEAEKDEEEEKDQQLESTIDMLDQESQEVDDEIDDVESQEVDTNEETEVDE
jgi:tetratricopeptide (TPR) repeat protein